MFSFNGRTSMEFILPGKSAIRTATLICWLVLLGTQPVLAQETSSGTPTRSLILLDADGRLAQQHARDQALFLPAERVEPVSTTSKAAANSITVIRPDGGEQVAVGSKLELEWISDNAGPLLIELYRGDRQLVRSIYRVEQAEGSTVWTLPPYIEPGNDYYVRISSYDNQSIFDTSKDVFTILPGSGPYIELLNPSGILWRQNKTESIEWFSESISGNIRIELLSGPALLDRVLTGTNGTINDGRFEYTVPANLDRRTDYYLGVRSFDDPSVWDTSFRFAVGYPEGNLGFVEYGSVADATRALDLTVEGRYAILEEEEYLRIIDAADPEDPRIVRSLGLGTQVNSNPVLDNGLLYLHYGEALLILDMSNPIDPERIGFLNVTGTVEQIFVHNNYVYEAAGPDGWHIIDASNPEVPELLHTFFSLHLDAEGIVVEGNTAIVDYGSAGAFRFDITDKSNPSSPSAIPNTSNTVESMTIQGDYAYFANGAGGLSIANITLSRTPEVVATLSLVGPALDVAVQDGYAFVATGEFGVRMIDVRQPTTPVEVGHYRTLDDNTGVDLANQKVYLAAGTEGLRILERAGLDVTGNPCQTAWPDLPNAEYVFKLAGLGDLDIGTVQLDLKSEKLFTKPSPIPLARYECTRGAIKDTYFYSNGNIQSQVFDAENRIDGVSMYSDLGARIGHLEFDKKEITSDNRLEAILYLHKESSFLPGSDLNTYSGWSYFEPAEVPVSMLIPPQQQFDAVDPQKMPVLFVHGVIGRYPYWSAEVLDWVESAGYNNWQLYYPYDQDLNKSSLILGSAIQEVLQGAQVDDRYSVEALPLVVHSMGGLVSRAYIQSDNYSSNVSKLLMLGTPNYGSRVAQRIGSPILLSDRDRIKVIEIFQKFYGPVDDKAPAYIQMSPGSNFLFRLNQNDIKPLIDTSDIISQYLVVAGYSDALFSELDLEVYNDFFHNEVSNQDDFVVSVSSASLLNKGVPLAVLPLPHAKGNDDQNLTTATASTILGFLWNGYDPTDPSLGGITGYWLPGDRASEPRINLFEDNGVFGNNLDIETGILALQFENLEDRDEIFYLAEKDPGQLVLSDNRFLSELLNPLDYVIELLPIRDPLYSPHTSSFALRTFTNIPRTTPPIPVAPPTMGLPLAEGTYQLGFNVRGALITDNALSPLDFLFVQFQAVTAFEFSHLQTSFVSVPLTSAEKSMIESNELIPSTSVTDKIASTTRSLTVDDGVAELSLLLGRLDNAAPLDFVITDPEGNEIGPFEASTLVGVDYVENREVGYAYYHVGQPAEGIWMISYSELQDEAVLFAPINGTSSLEFGVEPLAVRTGDYFNVFFRDPFSEQCNERQYNMSTTIYDPAEKTRNTIDIGQPEGVSGQIWYVLQTQAEHVGEYSFALDYTCVINDVAYTRQAEASLKVENEAAFVNVSAENNSQETVQSRVLGLNNYPNPFADLTTFRLTIPGQHRVSLIVFDALGRQVRTVLQDALVEGMLEQLFDASGLAPGTYFYTLSGIPVVGQGTVRKTGAFTLVR